MIGCAGTSKSPNPPTDPGVGSSTHTVGLSWTASVSSDVRGYNVFRAVYTNSCGSFSRINIALITNTSYTDSNVDSGASYCYATTAVDISNLESGYSNVVTDVQIPAF
jgi:fibronectin type 3 domain-containing protein